MFILHGYFLNLFLWKVLIKTRCGLRFSIDPSIYLFTLVFGTLLQEASPNKLQLRLCTFVSVKVKC